jgi:5,10-methylene-tetrahydrofolate dehydrogenase/methenyl tetrahydrofolate cyclohydrolase
MPARLLAVEELAASVTREAGVQIAAIRERNRPVHVKAVLLGEDPGAGRRVAAWGAACREAGAGFEVLHRPAGDAAGLEECLERLGADAQVTGVLLAGGPDAEPLVGRARRWLPRGKDVLGEHPASLAEALADFTGADCVPPLVTAVLAAFETNEIDLYDRLVLVVGPSRRVGLPLVAALAEKHANVALVSAAAEEPGALLPAAEVILVAGGVPRGSLGAAGLRPGAVLLDLGPPAPGGAGQPAAGRGAFAPDALEAAGAVLPAGALEPMLKAAFLQNVALCARELESAGLDPQAGGRSARSDQKPRGPRRK